MRRRRLEAWNIACSPKRKMPRTPGTKPRGASLRPSKRPPVHDSGDRFAVLSTIRRAPKVGITEIGASDSGYSGQPARRGTGSG
jgi:hypothetical protein